MPYSEARVYKKAEVIGTSPVSVEGAITEAVNRAQESLKKLSWFEVEEVRDHPFFSALPLNFKDERKKKALVLKIYQ